MLTSDIIKKIDSNEMLKAYDRWPEIAKESFATNYESIQFSGINHIVIAGMGGSGALGDIFASIMSKTKIHVSVVKGYLLPKTVDKNTLVITISISGDTIETLTVLKTAKDLDCHLIAFSSGGKMEKICLENGIQYRKILFVHSPRTSFVSFLFSILKILNSIIPVKENEVYETINALVKQRKTISSENLSVSNSAIELAKSIDRIPLIYFPAGLQAVAIRFKNSLQENAKIHAMSEDVIEASHNGIVAWERPSNVLPILIQGEEDYFKTKERWIIFKEFFEVNNIEYKEIRSLKGSIFSKLTNLIYFLDYTTVYHALLNNIDPSPVSAIDFIKARL